MSEPVQVFVVLVTGEGGQKHESALFFRVIDAEQHMQTRGLRGASIEPRLMPTRQLHEAHLPLFRPIFDSP